MSAEPRPKKGAYARRRKRAKARERSARFYGSPEYAAAVRSEGCAVPRLSPAPTECWGRPTVAHLEKRNRAEADWRRVYCLCLHHHIDEQEGNAEAFAMQYEFDDEAEAARMVKNHGHLVEAAVESTSNGE